MYTITFYLNLPSNSHRHENKYLNTNSLMDLSSICEESTWNVNINGTRGKLTISLANSNNIVKSIMNLNSPPAIQKLGTHDSVSPKLTFVRIMDTISTLLQIKRLDYLLSARCWCW
jgi:hypothetical protein